MNISTFRIKNWRFFSGEMDVRRVGPTWGRMSCSVFLSTWLPPRQQSLSFFLAAWWYSVCGARLDQSNPDFTHISDDTTPPLLLFSSLRLWDSAPQIAVPTPLLWWIFIGQCSAADAEIPDALWRTRVADNLVKTGEGRWRRRWRFLFLWTRWFRSRVTTWLAVQQLPYMKRKEREWHSACTPIRF